MDIALKLDTRSKNADEQMLVTGCLREERWAQKRLYEMYYPQMMGVCMRYANNQEDSRDILNEGYIKVFRNLHKYEVGTSLEAWIRRIMVNTSIDYFRRTARHQTEDLDNVRQATSHEEDAISRCSTEEIMKAVQQLPPSYRAVFNLYAIEGYSHKEVGEALGITESTSRSNLVKARMKLQDYLTKRNQSHPA